MAHFDFNPEREVRLRIRLALPPRGATDISPTCPHRIDGALLPYLLTSLAACRAMNARPAPIAVRSAGGDRFVTRSWCHVFHGLQLPH